MRLEDVRAWHSENVDIEGRISEPTQSWVAGRLSEDESGEAGCGR